MFGLKSQDQLHERYTELLLENMNSMYNFAYRLTFNREDANDLVQEASLRGFRFFHKFESGTNFKAWILTVLRNIFINQYRKKAKEPAKVDYEKVENYVGVPDITGFEDEIFSEHLQKAVDDLPEDFRSAIILYFVEGLSYKEMAKVMECPIGTIMSRLYAARQSLKKKLAAIKDKEATYDE